MPPRLIPERTVDSMLAVEVAQLLPRSLIWSPTNTRGQLDHQVFVPGGRVLSFECKGVVSDPTRDPAKPWAAPIDYPQLAAYIARRLPILFAFPAKPSSPERPWRRPCGWDRDVDGWCQACGNTGSAQRRRWAGEDPLISSAEIHVRLQPWFAHWCWVVPATDLDTHLTTNGRPADKPLVQGPPPRVDERSRAVVSLSRRAFRSRP